jgi:dTDP-4-amino-4,6-dideoxygalactose transaminase
MPDPADDLPALLGGRPAFPDGPPDWPLPDPAVHAALAASVADGSWGKYHAAHVPALEAELAAFHSVPHALTCGSGTLAVEAGLRALKVGPGDEVVLAGYDYEANFQTVHALGARPVLVDAAPHNWNLDPARLDAAFTPLTKAVVCSHLHGGLVPMREVMELAARHNVGVVEDAAQAAGATVQGRPAGTWGNVGALSFGGSKLLTAGRGGAVLVRDPHLAQRVKLFLHRGIQAWAPLSELQAAALRPQLAQLRDRTAHRFEFVRTLTDALSHVGVPGLTPFTNTTDDSTPAFYKVGFRYDPAAFGLTRDRFVGAMRAEGVAFDPGFRGLHLGRSPSRFRAAGELTNATSAHHGCVTIHHPVLLGTADTARRIANAIAKVHRHRTRIGERPVLSPGAVTAPVPPAGPG